MSKRGIERKRRAKEHRLERREDRQKLADFISRAVMGFDPGLTDDECFMVSRDVDGRILDVVHVKGAGV